ncbi:MAG: AmmeMemoRadiSam system protein B [Desulfovibrionaceae bacterium]
MNRKPVVAGQFYPGSASALQEQIRDFMAEAPNRDAAPSLLAMVPHAGYVFSGGVCGKTLGAANLRPLVVMLGPNHTGRGQPLAVWPEGRWETPDGGLMVDETVAQAVIDAGAGFAADTAAHLQEHSLEVVVPFLRALDPNTRIAPIAVSLPDPDRLMEAGRTLARTLQALDAPFSIVVSSDMSHYVPAERARTQDAKALEAVERLDPAGLFATVRDQDISMCGVMPMTMGLAAANELGASKARVVDYATSGDVNRDYTRVVGYAGVIVQ